jgi:GxxExxY protein
MQHLKDPFTHQIIGLAMAVHRSLGPGLKEESYHQQLVQALIREGIEHHSKPRSDLMYRGHVADTFEADIVFPERLIVELKALRGDFDKEHFTQLLSYNKFWRIRTGMLLDFGKPSLKLKRVIYTSHTSELPKLKIPSFVTDSNLAASIIAIAEQCLADIGLGYRETTWIGLMTAAFKSEGIPFVINPIVSLPGMGSTALRCLVIDNKAVLAISALGHEVTAIDRSYMQTNLRWLDLPWGIAVHFGKTTCDIRYISQPKNNLRVL